MPTTTPSTSTRVWALSPSGLLVSAALLLENPLIDDTTLRQRVQERLSRRTLARLMLVCDVRTMVRIKEESAMGPQVLSMNVLANAFEALLGTCYSCRLGGYFAVWRVYR